MKIICYNKQVDKEYTLTLGCIDDAETVAIISKRFVAFVEDVLDTENSYKVYVHN